MSLSGRATFATHDEPGRGNSARSALVTAYEECTAPNTTTSGLTAWPACAPPVRSDPYCGFGSISTSRASGRVKAKARSFDVNFSFTAKGLSLGCEGRTLCGVASVRVTTDRCESPPCTLVDLIDVPVTGTETTACCVVAGGVCRVRSSINAEILDALRAGERAGIRVLDCGLKRVDGPNPPTHHTFDCGFLAP